MAWDLFSMCLERSTRGFSIPEVMRVYVDSVGLCYSDYLFLRFGNPVGGKVVA